MATADPILAAPGALPHGYAPVVLFPQLAAVPLRLCLIVRQEPDPVAGRFVVLRNLLDAVVYLGCITDAGGRLHGYVEIWVQSLAGLAGSPAAAREALSNRALDDRWARLFKSYDAMDDQASGDCVLFRTGFETVHPAPLFYDAGKHEITTPIDAFSNAPWKLCTDDALLASKGLPATDEAAVLYAMFPQQTEAVYKGTAKPEVKEVPKAASTSTEIAKSRRVSLTVDGTRHDVLVEEYK